MSQSDDKSQGDVHLHITKTLYGTAEMKSASHQQAVHDVLTRKHGDTSTHKSPGKNALV